MAYGGDEWGSKRSIVEGIAVGSRASVGPQGYAQAVMGMPSADGYAPLAPYDDK